MMKRTIRFRAWDSEENEWYKPTHEAYKGNLWELLLGFSGDLLAHTIEGLEHESLWAERYKLMQSTGLKDDNGTEIYEGDVVRFQRRVATDRVIVWRQSNNGTGFNIGLGSQNDREIVGNIYENPELLTK